jgi:chromosome partitioning protein
MVIAITNLKGGVGKSMVSQNLAVALAADGQRVCIADTDEEQQNSLKWHTNRGDRLPKIDVFFIHPDKVTEQILALNKQYDAVVIDGTPSIKELTTRIIILSDFIFVPILPSISDVWALENFLGRFREAKLTKENLGGRVGAALILNRYNDKTNLDKEVQEAIKGFEIPLLENKISNLVAYREATVQGIGVIENKEGKSKEEFLRLYAEIKSFIS